MNTSATGGFLQPEPGLARSDIERLIGDVIAGITGLPRDLVRERIAVPQADPASRSVPNPNRRCGITKPRTGRA